MPTKQSYVPNIGIVYRIDREGTFTFLNDAIKKLGYEPMELLGKHFSDIILPADVEAASRSQIFPKYKGKATGDKNAPKLFDERRIGERKTTGLEIRLISKSGKLDLGVIEKIGKEEVVVEINSAGLYGIDSKNKMKVFIGTVGVIRDISVRKEAEEQLRQAHDELENRVKERTAELQAAKEFLEKQIIEIKHAEHKHSLIIKTALDGFWVCDLNGRFLEVNDSCCEMLAYTRKEMLTMSVVDIEASENPEEIAQHMKKVRALGAIDFEMQSCGQINTIMVVITGRNSHLVYFNELTS